MIPVIFCTPHRAAAPSRLPDQISEAIVLMEKPSSKGSISNMWICRITSPTSLNFPTGVNGYVFSMGKYGRVSKKGNTLFKKFKL
jgi:hypothetical protein